MLKTTASKISKIILSVDEEKEEEEEEEERITRLVYRDKI